MPIIEVNNVSKCFYLRHTREFLATGIVDSLFRRKRWEEFWALRNVSFTVERGESLGVVGPNGSGKTTMLSIVSAVTQPTEGSVRAEGRISALLQLGAGFHPDLTGRENVYINAGVLGFRRREIDRIYPSVAEFSELGTFLDTPIRRYSSGMLARLGFSIAIHVDPDIIIVDEVLGVGDQHFQTKCQEKILEFVDRGVTILFVSHSAAQVRKLCSRAVYLEEGNLAAYGEVEEVLGAYAARDNRGPTIGTGAQSGPAARPKPAGAVSAATMPKPAAAKPAAQSAPSAEPSAAMPKPAAESPVAAVLPEATIPDASAPAVKAETQEPEQASSKVRPIKGKPSGRLGPSCTGIHSATFFCRNAPQLDVLFDHVFPLVRDGSIVRVRCWACSIGAEPYTLAIEYERRSVSDYVLAIEAFDRDPELIQAALQGEYNERELFYEGFGFMSREILGRYFKQSEDGNHLLSEHVRRNVLFGTSDFLSPDSLALPPVDVVMAQNVLIHFDSVQARQILSSLVAQTKPGGVLALGGANPDDLVEAVREHGLEPLPRDLEAIHDGWRARRSQPTHRAGLGPLDRSYGDWQIRYCSLFRKPARPWWRRLLGG